MILRDQAASRKVMFESAAHRIAQVNRNRRIEDGQYRLAIFFAQAEHAAEIGSNITGQMSALESIERKHACRLAHLNVEGTVHIGRAKSLGIAVGSQGDQSLRNAEKIVPDFVAVEN